MNKLTDDQRQDLLARRAALEEEIRELHATPLSSKSAVAARFRQADLLELAGMIHKIDKKLGRAQ